MPGQPRQPAVGATCGLVRSDLHRPFGHRLRRGGPVVPMHRKQPLRSSCRAGLGTWGRPAVGANRAPLPHTHERAENPYMLKRITMGRRIRQSPAPSSSSPSSAAAPQLRRTSSRQGHQERLAAQLDIKNGTLKVKDLTPEGGQDAAEARHRRCRCHRLGRRHGCDRRPRPAGSAGPRGRRRRSDGHGSRQWILGQQPEAVVFTTSGVRFGPYTNNSAANETSGGT